MEEEGEAALPDRSDKAGNAEGSRAGCVVCLLGLGIDCLEVLAFALETQFGCEDARDGAPPSVGNASLFKERAGARDDAVWSKEFLLLLAVLLLLLLIAALATHVL